ncbi:MAG: MgtC/SapB family protein [Terracidiphilus sp.]|jgi:putative Mg2+ transporter-C (MgtC) family protein
MSISEHSGQGVKQFVELGMAFLLSAVIGLEREIRHKSAELRTYTIIGTAAALFLLISKYGFTDVLVENRIVLDPFRVAAQIVSGIGFIGAGLIFVREDKVNRLTTAATVWLVTAIGMAYGAGFPSTTVVDSDNLSLLWQKFSGICDGEAIIGLEARVVAVARSHSGVVCALRGA